MENNKTLIWCDKLLVFFFCALVYFLPISIALVEWFSGLAITTFFVKRSVLFSLKRKALRESGISTNPSFFEKVKYFLKAFKPASTSLSLPVGIFLLINFLSVLFSQYPSLSLKGFFFKILQNVFIYFSFVEGIQTKKKLKAVISVYFISATLIGINGLFQYATGHGFIHRYPMWDEGRISSCFKQANDFASYLLITLFPVMAFLTSRRSGLFDVNAKKESRKTTYAGRTFLWILSGILLICLGLTYSRGAWISFFVALIVLSLQRKRAVPALILVAICFLSIFSQKIFIARKTVFLKSGDLQKIGDIKASSVSSEVDAEIDNFIHSRLGNLGPREWIKKFFSEASGRMGFWEEAFNIICDYPIIGAGLNTYTKMGDRYRINWGGYPHNCYLQMAAETGLSGLLAFIWVIVTCYKTTLRKIRLVKDRFLESVMIGFLAALAGFLTHSFFDTNIYSLQLGNMMWIALGIIMSAQRIAESQEANGCVS